MAGACEYSTASPFVSSQHVLFKACVFDSNNAATDQPNATQTDQMVPSRV